MASNSLGVADHCQQMTGRQRVIGIVANTDFVREQEWVCYRPAKLVAVFGFGAPMNTAVSRDFLCCAVDTARRLVVEEAVGLFVEDILADHPAPVMSVSR